MRYLPLCGWIVFALGNAKALGKMRPFHHFITKTAPADVTGRSLWPYEYSLGSGIALEIVGSYAWRRQFLALDFLRSNEQ